MTLSGDELKEFQRLKQAADQGGDFETKSYLGNQFREYLASNAVEQKKYKETGSRKAAGAFRAEWALKRFSDFKETRTFQRTWSHTDTTRGRYKNFAKIIQDYGGWRSSEAILGATNAALMCLSMAGDWVRVHSQSQLVEFLILEDEWQDDFKKAWSHYREESQGGNTAVKTDAVADDKGKAVGKAQAAGKAKSAGEAGGQGKGDDKSKVAGKAKAKAKASPVKKEPLDISTFDALGLWREGIKLKTLFQQTTCSSVGIIDKITDDAKSPLNVQNLVASMDELKDKLTPWHKEFVMAGDIQLFKKKYPTARAETELATFLVLAGEIALLLLKAKSFMRSYEDPCLV